MVYTLKKNEQAVLHHLLLNEGLSHKEIGKKIGINEASVRRICNKLRQENVYYNLNVPNFSLLGKKVLMVQKIHISSPHLIEIRNIINNILADWGSCVDCKETFDGRIIVRSIWENTQAFRKAHAAFFKKHGTEWLTRESIDLIPLGEEGKFIRVKSFL
ncbi:winged helix-turn-helix domain-containing protein [Candidatus Woesearchaeota archaeon]|nr:winged helix-turn-helix domain-containing protein [Candidatus Woesearchaeota archaeon]